MSDAVGNAVLSISLDEASAKRVFSALDDLKKKTGETAAAAKTISFLEMGKGLLEVGKVGFEALSKITEGILELGSRGADVDDVSASFEQLAKQAGSTGDAMLGQLRTGVVGTLSDFDLMSAANRAMGAGLIKSADDMGTLAAGARLLAKTTGTDTGAAFDKLTEAMARGRVSGLKSMGLFVDSKAAVLEYAKSHHTTVGALDEEQKAAAVSQAALAALHERLKQMPPDAADFGEKIKQGSVALSNFRDRLAQAVAHSPVLAAAMDSVGKSIQGAFGPGQQGVINAVIHTIESMAVVAARVVEGVIIGAGVLVQAWYGVKTVLIGIETAVAAVVTANVAAIAGVIDLASKVPGVGDKLSGVKLAADNLRDSMKGATVSLAEQTAEAARGAAGHSELQGQLEKVAGVVSNVGDAMAAASGQTIKLGDALPPIGPKAAEAAGAVKDHAQEIAAVLQKLNQDILLDQKEGLDKRLQVVENEKQAEIQKAKELTGGVGAAYDEMVAKATQRAEQRAALEIAAGDEIKRHEIQLQQEHDLALTTGTARQLLEIQQKEDAELQSIEHLRLTRSQDFANMTALIHQNYDDQRQHITNHYRTIDELMKASGLKTREELQRTLEETKRVYDETLNKEKFTDGERQKAYEAMMTAQQAVDDKVHLNRMQQMDILTGSMSSMLRSIFGKSKAAAIAAAIIDTYAAVAKALSAYPWPLNLVPAAAALAAGMAQVNQIRNSNPSGFRTGTPGLDFSNFGTSTVSVLHGQEAVIPRGKGHMLAGEIAAAMPGGGSAGGAELVGLVRTQIALMQDLPRQIGRAVRNTRAMGY